MQHVGHILARSSFRGLRGLDMLCEHLRRNDFIGHGSSNAIVTRQEGAL